MSRSNSLTLLTFPYPPLEKPYDQGPGGRVRVGIGSKLARGPGRIPSCFRLLTALFLPLGMFWVSEAGASAAVSPADRRAEETYRQALERTYIHGITDQLAQQVLGVDAVPLLRRLLLDPGFPRRDNVVAFLAHLDSGDATRDLLAFLAHPPAGWSAPEEDRALLLAPVALGHIARRGDTRALDVLLGMTGEEGDAPRPAGEGYPAPLRADLTEMALRGLAFSGMPAARDRLLDISHERIRVRGDGRDLSLSALRSLDLFRELHEDPSPPNALEPGPRPGPPVVPEIFDTQARVHDNALTYANHVDVPSPMGDTRLDAVLENSSLRAGRADHVGDVACCITVSRSGTAGSFGIPGDGLDIVDDGTEMSSVLNNGVGRIKVVRAINHCGGPGSNIIGCGQTPGDGIAVVRLGSENDERFSGCTSTATIQAWAIPPISGTSCSASSPAATTA